MKDKFFGKHPNVMPLPDLIELQRDSFKWFRDKGLKELFEEVSPIRDWSGKDLDLYFGDYYFDEPKYTEAEAKSQNVSFEAPLRVKLRLVNRKTQEVKEQEIYLGEFPLMTEHGTFIVNGVERVVVSQLIRSSGAFFTAASARGRKLFGAKIIPNRGAWLEFETDHDNTIYVKIDRKRKVPVTSLLRAFGIADDESLLATFKDVDTDPENHYIETTIKRDAARNQGEGFIEVYKRLRPGDLATVDNAQQMIEAMFFDFERYDMAKVGRWKFNLRLGLNVPMDKEHRILRPEDLVLVIKEIIKLNNTPGAQPDDIDHLANRRVRALGELLQNKLRVGMARIERIVKDRMTTLDVAAITPAQLVNIRPFMAAVKEFFTTSQLSQFMDQVNPLAELEHKRRISAMGPGGLTRERAGFEVRDVHTTYYGRICPIQTPEGPNIGLIGTLASFARVNEFGFLETPYRKVKNGRVTNELIYLNAYEEQKFSIAHAGMPLTKDGHFVDDRVEARVHGQAAITKPERIGYMDVSPQQFISVATSLIPFLEHDDATRALMGSNMQRQSVSCIKPDAPLVGTGVEKKAALDSGQLIVAKEEGVVAEVDADHVAIKSAKGKISRYSLQTFSRTNQFTSIDQHPAVKKGENVRKGDILAEGASIDKGRLALGQNLLVAFLSWRGFNFEDAIILSERVLQEDRYTSIHIEDFSCHVRETKLGPEVTTPDIPNVGEERLKDLDEEGIVRVGAEVGPNDILVGKISPKGEADLTAEERLLRAIFGEKARDVKDTSLRMPYGKRGRIIGIKVFSREKGDKLPVGVIKTIQVEVAQLRKVMVGDKLAGRHGNKGVISRVLPLEEMPYLADGTPVDIILNPLGVASRMNIGQILETHLGLAAHSLGYLAQTPSLDGATEEEIKEELKKAGYPSDGKMILYDGQTGEPFGQKVTVGYMYVMKLHHLVEDKIHMRSIGPYSLITQQPLGGKAQFGGQRFGEMEVWALEGYGAAHTLQEVLTIKSDDVLGRANAYDAIIRGLPIKAPHVPASFNVLVSELKALALNVDLIGVKEESEEGGKPMAEKETTRE
ncbi:DNA-directed RNA polymerase subunit beta [Patescibacteria group bacterium]|nr:DNA-directed RNA polymerase subunit beta [Patescibacteria group bacterium]MBU2265133.1 DNA-directed RNA polymerase subunit beta [Patescibacteria group bacterium]